MRAPTLAMYCVCGNPGLSCHGFVTLRTVGRWMPPPSPHTARPDVTATRSLRRRRAVAAIALAVVVGAASPTPSGDLRAPAAAPAIAAGGGSSAAPACRAPASSGGGADERADLSSTPTGATAGWRRSPSSAALTNAAQTPGELHGEHRPHDAHRVRWHDASAPASPVPATAGRWSARTSPMDRPARAPSCAAWLPSPPHAANMLQPGLHADGLGLAYARGVYWWCLVLARPG